MHSLLFWSTVSFGDDWHFILNITNWLQTKMDPNVLEQPSLPNLPVRRTVKPERPGYRTDFVPVSHLVALTEHPRSCCTLMSVSGVWLGEQQSWCTVDLGAVIKPCVGKFGVNVGKAFLIEH